MDGLAVAVRFLLYLDLMALFGITAFSLHALRGPERVSGALLPLASLAAGTSIGGVLLSLLGVAALAAGLAGTGLLALDREMLGVLLFETASGTASLLRVAALTLTFAAALMLRRGRSATVGTALVVLFSGLALASLAWGGHGVAGEGAFGWLQLVGDIVHLLAAGVWVGALLALLLLVLRRADRIDGSHLLATHRALAGFSSIGTIVVALLIATGLINLLTIIGWAGIVALPASAYGLALLGKLGLFAAMLVLAASNRFRLVPRFERAMAAEDHSAALSALRLSLSIEAVCAIAILALVAWFGTLDPAGAV